MGYLILIIIGLLMLWLVLIYNSFVRLRVQITNGWAQIDVQLKRRHDLIPNLVSTVRGYMKYEQETLIKVMEARTKAISATGVTAKATAEGELSGTLSRLFALVENYPETTELWTKRQTGQRIYSFQTRRAKPSVPRRAFGPIF